MGGSTVAHVENTSFYLTLSLRSRMQNTIQFCWMKLLPIQSTFLFVYDLWIAEEVWEEFLSFVPLQQITGKQIVNTLIGYCQEKGIPLANMRALGYDMASSMSSSRSGVQAYIDLNLQL